MDLSSSNRSLNHCHTLTKSFDSLNINFNPNPNLSNQILANTHKRIKPASSSALLLNVPINPIETDGRFSVPGLRDSEIVSKIAAEFDFPLPESLTSLKRINVASKSPTKSKDTGRKWSGQSSTKTVNLKIKFKTKNARDRFVAGVNSTLGLGGIKGVPLDSEANSGQADPSVKNLSTSAITSASHVGWFRKLLNKRWKSVEIWNVTDFVQVVDTVE